MKLLAFALPVTIIPVETIFAIVAPLTATVTFPFTVAIATLLVPFLILVASIPVSLLPSPTKKNPELTVMLPPAVIVPLP